MEFSQFSLLRSFQRVADTLLYVAHRKGCGQKILQGKWRTAVFLRSLPPTHPLTTGTAHVFFATSKSSRSFLLADSSGSSTLYRWKLPDSYKLNKIQVVLGAYPVRKPSKWLSREVNAFS